MSRSVARKIYADVFAKWPKQELRPDYQLQDVVRKAVEQRLEKATPALEAQEVVKARALQMLLQNRFSKNSPLQGSLLHPKSQPTYFDDVVREIAEAPNRSWLERVGQRLRGMVRLE